MSFPARPPLLGEPIAHLSANARLPLTPERAEAVAPLLDGVNALIDSLDDLDLAEVPPATAFDARWE